MILLIGGPAPPNPSWRLAGLATLLVVAGAAPAARCRRGASRTYQPLVSISCSGSGRTWHATHPSRSATILADFVDSQCRHRPLCLGQRSGARPLRLLEERESWRAALRAALAEGEASGGAEELDLDGPPRGAIGNREAKRFSSSAARRGPVGDLALIGGTLGRGPGRSLCPRLLSRSARTSPPAPRSPFRSMRSSRAIARS